MALNTLRQALSPILYTPLQHTILPPYHSVIIPILCWNRNPVARFPKKANHGALPKSHALRRIRKRLRTGR